MLRAYVALTKPRIIELLLVTTVPAMMLAAGGLPPLGLVLATLVGGSLAAGAPTRSTATSTGHRRGDAPHVARPLARHAVSPRVGAGLRHRARRRSRSRCSGGHHRLAAGAAAAVAILFYVLVYTLVLKRRTAQNIVWGGAAGCMPVLIGWAAVTGSLAWPAGGALRRRLLLDAAALLGAGHAVPGRLRRGPACRCCRWSPPRLQVARQIVGYTWLTVATSLLLWPLATGWVYGAVALAAGGWFLAAAHRLLAQVRDTARSRAGAARPQAVRLFHLSNSYLALLFVAVAVDALVR